MYTYGSFTLLYSRNQQRCKPIILQLKPNLKQLGLYTLVDFATPCRTGTDAYLGSGPQLQWLPLAHRLEDLKGQYLFWDLGAAHFRKCVSDH